MESFPVESGNLGSGCTRSPPAGGMSQEGSPSGLLGMSTCPVTVGVFSCFLSEGLLVLDKFTFAARVQRGSGLVAVAVVRRSTPGFFKAGNYRMEIICS